MAAIQWGSCLYKNEVPTLKCLEPLFQNVLQAIVAFVGVGLFIMLIMGGFFFLFSAGDPKKMERARGTLSTAAIGVVLIISTYLIFRIIESFTGLKLTEFKVDVP